MSGGVGPLLLVMTRVIAQARETVFAEWSKPERLARWWTTDPRSTHADASRIQLSIRELVPSERIVFTWGGEHADTTTLVTITLSDDGGYTRLVLHQGALP